VVKKSLIICEGPNDRDFLEQLLKHLEIQNIDIQFLGRDAKNKSSIFKREKYGTVSQELGSVYKNLLIIFDADYLKNDAKYGGYENSEREIQELISELDLKNTDYYIVCNPDTKDGYLESLILSTTPEDQQECIGKFLECSKFESKDSAKAIWNKIYKLGYPNSPYDFSHKNFDELKNQLEKVSNE
jgi:hypothetical protein